MSTGQPYFGNWLRKTRIGRGITQDELEVSARYSQAVISRIEKGDDGYSADFVIAVATALGEDVITALELSGKLKTVSSEELAQARALFHAGYTKLDAEEQNAMLLMIKSLYLAKRARHQQ